MSDSSCGRRRIAGYNQFVKLVRHGKAVKVYLASDADVRFAESIKRELSGVPAIIENIQIENVDFSETYERAVEQAAKAKADVERAKSELARVEQEAQQKVKNAEAEAAATKARAEADAYSIKIQGEAEAEVIRQRGQALKDNPAMIELIKAERWDGKLPQTIVPGSTMPFMEIK